MRTSGHVAGAAAWRDAPAYHPRIISWNITGACNLGCQHCYLDARSPLPGELNTAEALRLIDQMAAAGTELLILTGGEPLLRADLPLLARRAAGQGIHVVLGTNGTLLDGAAAQMLKASGVNAAGISLDSLDPAKHDVFRGLPGSWERTVAAMAACRQAGLEVLVHTTALRMNDAEIPGLVRFAHEQGARVFQLFFLVCTGRGERLTDLSPHEYKHLLDFILDAQGRYPGMMVRARCAPYIQGLAQQRGSAPPWSAGCLAGTGYCRITPTGDVTPCPYLPTAAGNVREQDFTQIWESSPVLARFRLPQRRLQGRCGECPLSQGDDPLCVGCRARALALAGDDQAADPWCLYQPGAAAEPPGHPAQEVIWTEAAQDRLQRIPAFIRGRIRQAVETFARQQGLAQITPGVLQQLRERVGSYGSHGSHGGP